MESRAKDTRLKFKSENNFTVNKSKYAVIGEGPTGITSLIEILNNLQDGQTVEWFRKRSTGQRRHIVNIDGRQMSIRQLESNLEKELSSHPRFKQIKSKGEFNINEFNTDAEHVFVCDGYNSAVRNQIFSVKTPTVRLIDPVLVVYTGLSPLNVKADMDKGSKDIFSVDKLKKNDIENPNNFINLMKIAYSQLDNPYVKGFSSSQDLSSQTKTGLREFFNEENQKELIKKLKDFQFSDDEIKYYSNPNNREEILKNFDRDNDSFSKMIKKEGGEIIVVPVFRKDSYFGKNGLSAIDESTGQNFVIMGDAAYGYAPGGPNIEKAMSSAKKIVQVRMRPEKNVPVLNNFKKLPDIRDFLETAARRHIWESNKSLPVTGTNKPNTKNREVSK